MLAHVTAAAAGTGRTITHVTSDVRAMLDEYAEWGTQSHGAVITAAATVAARTATTFLLPASHTYLELYPWGSHPLLDPLWSGATLQVEHDGADVSRTEKIRRIASDDAILDHLRVCWRTTTDINCSQCEKCVRTMTTLKLLGKLERARTFSGELPMRALREMKLANESDLSFALDNLALAQSVGHAGIADALNIAIRNGRADLV